MSPTFSIGRIAGVQVGVNWSWAIVFALLVWSLDATIFPARDPGLGGATYAAMAVVAALLFFASLLLHELGHALEARREGVEIENITLWLFGGVARLRGELPSARAEFRIAIAGPLVTAVLGLGFLGLAGPAHLPGPVDGVIAWLGYVNLFLLGFNMLPALPLDGGRVLRSALWAGKHDFARATVLAAGVGRAFGVAMIAGGLALFAGLAAVGGIWLALIGWFLLAAAGAEARHLAVRQALAGVKVRHLMVVDPVTALPGQTLAEFLRATARSPRHTAYPVLVGSRVVGVLPLSRVLAVPRAEWSARRVRDTMLPPGEVPVLHREEDAVDALAELSEGDLHRGVVLEDGRLAGFVSITDISRLVEARGAAA